MKIQTEQKVGCLKIAKFIDKKQDLNLQIALLISSQTFLRENKNPIQIMFTLESENKSMWGNTQRLLRVHYKLQNNNLLSLAENYPLNIKILKILKLLVMICMDLQER